jgi:hypothetical protein
MREISRSDYLARTPDKYLATGFHGPDGSVRRELLADDALAAGTQLIAAGAAPQELAFTYEAIRALLPLHREDADAASRLDATLAEALSTVARMIRQPNNEGIMSWCLACASFVRDDADIDALLAHMQAVLRIFELLAQGAPQDDGSSPEAPSGSASDGEA